MNKKHLVFLLMAMFLLAIDLPVVAETPLVFALNNDRISLLVDSDGNVIVPPGKYHFISRINDSDDLFVARIPDPETKQMEDGGQEELSRSTRRPFVILNKKGEVQIDTVFDASYSIIYSLPSGHFIFIIWGDTGGKVGVMDDKFNAIIDAAYEMIIPNGVGGYIAALDYSKPGVLFAYSRSLDCTRVDMGVTDPCMVRGFVDGLCLIRCEVEKTLRYGYIGPDGHWAIEPAFRIADPFINGYATVSLDGRSFGVIDKSGDWVIEPIYKKIIRDIDREENRAFVAYLGEQIKIISEDNFKELPIPVEPKAKVEVRGEYIFVSHCIQDFNENSVKLYNIDGTLINQSQEYNWVNFPGQGDGKVIRYTFGNYPSGKGNVLYDVTGKTIATRDEFANLLWKIDEVNGDAIYGYVFIDYEIDPSVKWNVNTKCGLIDDEGNIRVAADYGLVDEFNYGSGYYYALKGEEWGLINIEGEWVVRLIGDEIQ